MNVFSLLTTRVFWMGLYDARMQKSNEFQLHILTFQKPLHDYNDTKY